MMNKCFSSCGFGFFISVETLRYAYPESLVKVEYKKKGEVAKTFFLRVGYFNGHLCYKSKKKLSKQAQIELYRYCSVVSFDCGNKVN